MKVLKEDLRIAVEGIHIKTFTKGTPDKDLPADVLEYATEKNLLVAGKAAKGGDDDKAAKGGDENK